MNNSLHARRSTAIDETIRSAANGARAAQTKFICQLKTEASGEHVRLMAKRCRKNERNILEEKLTQIFMFMGNINVRAFNYCRGNNWPLNIIK